MCFGRAHVQPISMYRNHLMKTFSRRDWYLITAKTPNMFSFHFHWHNGRREKYLWIEEPPYSSQPCSSETFKNLNSSKKRDKVYYSIKKNTVFIVYHCFYNMTSPNPQHHWWDDCKSIARGLDLKLLIIIWRDVEMLL